MQRCGCVGGEVVAVWVGCGRGEGGGAIVGGTMRVCERDHESIMHIRIRIPA